MILSICFIVVDIVAVTGEFSKKTLPDGINPFWKLAFVFKCLTDTIILDDFNTALDRLTEAKLQRIDSVTGAAYHHDPLGSPRRGRPRPRPQRQPSNVQHIEDDLEDPSAENGKELSFQDALRMSERTEVPAK